MFGRRKFNRGDKIQVIRPDSKYYLKYGYVQKKESRGFVEIKVNGKTFVVVTTDIQFVQ